MLLFAICRSEAGSFLSPSDIAGKDLGGCKKMETNLQVLPKIVMYFKHSFQCETVIN